MEPAPTGIFTFTFDTLPAGRVREVAAELDELGYGAIWLPEVFGRDPFVAASLLLGATDRLSVGTGIASIYFREAPAMAAAARSLAEAHPGRFVLGLGVSHGPMVEGYLQREYGPPIETMRAYLDRLDGSVYSAAAPSEEPLRVLAALGPRMLALAAERAGGALTYNVPLEHTSAARRALGPERLLAVEQKAVLETDAATARQVGRAALGVYLGLPNYANNLLRHGFTADDLADGGSDRLIDALVAWGDVDAVRERVQAQRDAGADHVCVQVLTTDPRRAPLEEWRRLAPALLG